LLLSAWIADAEQWQTPDQVQLAAHQSDLPGFGKKVLE
jgi:hypothetical protein